jgi:acyl-coenzyme A synthetase/AMP-(fatty) acid ligase
MDLSTSLTGLCQAPALVDFVELIPRNPSGKILKKDLRAPYWVGQVRKVH